MSVDALRELLRSGGGDQQVIEKVLKEKRLHQLSQMTTPKLQALAKQDCSEWPKELVEYVLQGRSQTIAGDSVEWEWWREQD